MAVVMLAACAVAAGFFGSKIPPTSFLPDEDQGYVYLNFQLPKAASLQRTDEVCRKIEKIVAQVRGVEYYTSVAGFSLLSGVLNTFGGFFSVTFKEWAGRTKREEQYHEIEQRLNRELALLPDATAFSFSPPAIPGVGSAGGFTFVLEDRAGRDIDFLGEQFEHIDDGVAAWEVAGTLRVPSAVPCSASADGTRSVPATLTRESERLSPSIENLPGRLALDA